MSNQHLMRQRTKNLTAEYREAVQDFERIKAVTMAAGAEPGKPSTIAANLGEQWSIVYWSAVARMTVLAMRLRMNRLLTMDELRAQRAQALAEMGDYEQSINRAVGQSFGR